MDFKAKVQEIFGNIKEKFLALSEKITDFYVEQKKLALIIASSVLAVLICLVIILACTGKKEKKVEFKTNLELTEKLVNPDGPVLPRDYNISRKTKDKWSEEDAEEWFTVPADKEIEALSKSNDAIVNEIIGAAP